MKLERWKNIRTAYIWSLKPPKFSKESYYLTEHLAFLQPYLKEEDTSSNLDVDTATEESNTNQNYGSETLVEEDMLDEASFVQLIEKPAHKSLSQTYKKWKGKDQVDDAFTE